MDAIGVEARTAPLLRVDGEAVGEGLGGQGIGHHQLTGEAKVAQPLHELHTRFGLHGEHQGLRRRVSRDLARNRAQTIVETGVRWIEGPGPGQGQPRKRCRGLHHLGQKAPVGIALVHHAEALRFEHVPYVGDDEATLGAVVVDHAEVPGIVPGDGDAGGRSGDGRNAPGGVDLACRDRARAEVVTDHGQGVSLIRDPGRVGARSCRVVGVVVDIELQRTAVHATGRVHFVQDQLDGTHGREAVLGARTRRGTRESDPDGLASHAITGQPDPGREGEESQRQSREGHPMCHASAGGSPFRLGVANSRRRLLCGRNAASGLT
jgi:hypothetical protein